MTQNWLDPFAVPIERSDGVTMPQRHRIVLGPGITPTDLPDKDATKLDTAGAGTVLALEDHAAFRALPSAVDKQVFIFKSPPGTFVYNSGAGSGVADDDKSVLKLTAVGLGSNGRAFGVALAGDVTGAEGLTFVGRLTGDDIFVRKADLSNKGRWNNTGLRIGDGTAAAEKLDVLGNVKVSGVITANEAAADVILRDLVGVIGYGALYIGVAPSGSNYIIASDGTGEVILNGPSGTVLGFRLGNSPIGRWMSTGLRVGDNTAPSEKLEVAGNIVVGASNPATTGVIRIPNNLYISARNAANSGNLDVWKANASDKLQTGLLTVAGSVLTDATGVVSSAADMIVVRKTADESVTSSTALQNDDHLVFALLANEVWTVKYVIWHTCLAGGNTDIQLNLPSGATYMLVATITDSTGSKAQVSTNPNTRITILTLTDAAALLEIEVTIVNGANAGNAQLQWCQTSSSGTATVFKLNSALTAIRKN